MVSAYFQFVYDDYFPTALSAEEYGFFNPAQNDANSWNSIDLEVLRAGHG
jgi:hypothetical protein